jgi:hypothetical protein
MGRPATTVGPNDAKIHNPPMTFVFAPDGTAETPKERPRRYPNNRPQPAAPEKEP